MAQLRQDYQRFIEQQTAILVIGPEQADRFRRYFTENALPFIGLPDPGHAVLKLYGQEVSLFRLGRMPAQVIVDKAGIARYAHYGRTMRDIPPNAGLLAVLEELNAPAP